MSPMGDVRNETIDHVFSVNLYAPIYAMRKAIQVFLEQGNGGNIVNIASLGGMRTVAGAVYSASKAAVISLPRNVTDEVFQTAVETAGYQLTKIK